MSGKASVQLSEEQLSDEQVSDEQVSDEQVSDEQVSDEQVSDEQVSMFTLSNANNMEVKILTLGGIIKEITMPDVNNALKHCIQTFDTIDEYMADESYRGAIVGRYANRIGNGCFSLNGTTYHLDKNNGEHNLHGGNAGFHKRNWASSTHCDDQSASVTLTLLSGDGEGGFPGNVAVTACYTLNNDNELSLHIKATTDKATPLSFTQHAYFTLSNESSVESTVLTIAADEVTDADSTLLPNGEFVAVNDTPFDFRVPTQIGKNVHDMPSSELFEKVGGYDHNYVLRQSANTQPQAEVSASDTGLTMKLYTNLPGLQFYTGNLKTQQQMGALCLEPQFFPDSPNKPHFPNCIVTPDSPLDMEISYAFSVTK
ncbi:galactose-1-epimerase [Alteromonas genovensis]|uniref:Aldose 1-epimerase n=2 Tax=Alteromonas genovensis TaxID=471225 RepID=A0A6N9TFG1_9ALTE|nr:galactose-1-epimerase [Alteromonas genovensis]